MAHEISQNASGEYEMFSGSGEVPWHRLGTIVSGLLTSQEAIKTAKLDWKVEKRIMCFNDEVQGEIETPCWATVRTDCCRYLGSVRKGYRIVQNSEAFEFFDQIVGEKKAVYDTAGALFGGKSIWIMAKLPGELFVGGNKEDSIQKYILLTNNHDGFGSVRMMQVALRVVCNNTLSAALKGATNSVSIRHTENYLVRVEDTQKALKLALGYFNDLDYVLGQLAKEEMTKKQVAGFAEKLLPDQQAGELVISRQNARTQIVRLFSEGAGNKGKSRWDCLNAVTDWVDHSRNSGITKRDQKGEGRFQSMMFGEGSRIKQKALDLLIA